MKCAVVEGTAVATWWGASHGWHVTLSCPGVQGFYYRHKAGNRTISTVIMPGSTRIVPLPHAPNMILPFRLDDDDDDNDDHGIEIRNILLMWWRIKKIALLLLLLLLPFRRYRFFLILLLLRYEQCTITTLPPRQDGFHTLQYHDPYE